MAKHPDGKKGKGGKHSAVEECAPCSCLTFTSVPALRALMVSTITVAAAAATLATATSTAAAGSGHLLRTCHNRRERKAGDEHREQGMCLRSCALAEWVAARGASEHRNQHKAQEAREEMQAVRCVALRCGAVRCGAVRNRRKLMATSLLFLPHLDASAIGTNNASGCQVCGPPLSRAPGLDGTTCASRMTQRPIPRETLHGSKR
ncbi:hypothetical protein TcWFU_003249 [Taenia crassiceps]|uniref:Uncharacterized protein n=1 Tax=Taenia crassiceps TaxID=6207 RepID=A0ABR4QAR5_9CEST